MFGILLILLQFSTTAKAQCTSASGTWCSGLTNGKESTNVDCDSDGLTDMTCFDPDSYQRGTVRTGTSCTLNSYSLTTGIAECTSQTTTGYGFELPCSAPTIANTQGTFCGGSAGASIEYVYSNVDCDGDGWADHACVVEESTSQWNAPVITYRVILSGTACVRDGSATPASCPAATGFGQQGI
uniref:SUEL-type lectin domain-containing protein n=1 Tax=Chromera velia CCMP2878 TaxID=1169474 RepID=A0A0K6S9Z7_9ALVE|eukprot:Cvel_9148.t1-p1 / transcript=Cvel_9148.t1 / gene=Cvel_9148 / organism=Chromera_velia_CCMP2878 / gene_product=hypothetical protein / transcript_product=hypothetical protein / location=Cvel_scaffold520:78509-79708(+) / protein_length=183 / sequence_SO=supercontig / SO=protein_coding / is_pseudo=false